MFAKILTQSLKGIMLKKHYLSDVYTTTQSLFLFYGNKAYIFSIKN